MNEMNTNKTEPVKRDTYVDLFNGMMKMAREAGALAEFDKIADYEMCDCFDDAAKRPISSYEFKTSLVVDYGGSEGIYIDGYLVGTLDLFNDAKQAEERDRVKHANMGRTHE